VRGVRDCRTGHVFFCPMWYAVHNGSDGPLCSVMLPFTAKRQGVSSVTLLTPVLAPSNTELPRV